ncbi:MAG: hypothetical protein HZA51_03585 [Planctomycetes bacterium]|nr:hypothetical protein [Planctomycetota bacterium]
MKVRRRKLTVSLAAASVLAVLIAGCIPADQTFFAPSGDPIAALIGFAIDFSRQILAAFLF